MEYITFWVNVLVNELNWFFYILEKLSFIGIFIALFTIWQLFRFLIIPIVGNHSGQSDSVKKKKDNSNE